MSIDEFVITNFIVGGDTTLPVLLWGMLTRHGVAAEVNGVATVLLVLSLPGFKLALVVNG